MSTIDRAMLGEDLDSPAGSNAANGEDRESTLERALKEREAAPTETATAASAPTPTPAAPDPVRAGAVAPAPVPQPPAPEAPVPPPAATATSGSSAPAASAVDQRQPDPAPAPRGGAGTDVASSARQPNFFEVDTARLEAQGFVLPETGPQRLAEEYRHIKRRVLGNMVPGMLKTDRPLNLVMITSSVPGEGKTFTSVNIALSIAAELDKTVLVVDSDIIKSDLTRAFGLGNQLGLFDYLENPAMGVENVIYRTSIDSLSIIPAGRSSKAISEKLASGMMQRLTDELAARYSDRVIIFDCPPVLATTGAVALAPHVSQVVMVVEARDTAQATIREALRVIGEERVTGVILNKSKHGTTKSDYYYQGYGYHQPSQTSAG